MGKEQYISLIAKKLGSELNTAELRELNGWLSSNSDNAELLDDFKFVWDSVESYKSSEVFDSSSAFQKFSKKYDLEGKTAPQAPVSPSPEPGFPILRWVLMGSIAIGLFLGGYFLSSRLTPTFNNTKMEPMAISLGPNASATLKPNSSLHFQPKKSLVTGLTGGAYMDLTERDKTQSLNVDLGNLKLSAHGSSFNVQNYKGEDVIIDVEKGAVNYDHNNKASVLKEGQKLRISKKNGASSIEDINSQNAFAWSEGRLSFDNTPLFEVFNTIEKFYGVEITVKDNVNVNTHYTVANLEPSGVDEVLEVLANSLNLRIEKEGRTIAVSGL